jgi:hypothetical protein
MTVLSLARAALLVIAGLGTLAGAQLSFDHLQQGEICPMLGPIPACIIVFLGYFSVLIATVFIKHKESKTLFYCGWTPIFLLALFGVTLELTKGHICPPGAASIPQCFYSFAMAVAALGLFRFVHSRTRQF